VDLNAVLGGVIIVPRFNPALQREACVFREFEIADDELRNRAPPGGAEGVPAKSRRMTGLHSEACAGLRAREAVCVDRDDDDVRSPKASIAVEVHRVVADRAGL
jgi:hypothetical protein